MSNLIVKPKSFRLKNKTINNLNKIHKETGLSYDSIFSEMIRSYFKKLEKRRKVEKKEK